MRIGIIGASGLLGGALARLAAQRGHEVVGYSRKERSAQSDITWRKWDAQPDLTGLDGIANFAGESVAQRWTEAKKREFRQSRIGVTSQLISRLDALPKADRPKVLVNASAVGYYGHCGDRELEEASPSGEGFLAQLCVDWEQTARQGEELGLRVVRGRVGIVLGKEAEAWQKMETLFRFGLGGPLGSGEQWMPWVHVEDVAGAALFALENEEVEGPVNWVSPEPVRNQDFTKALANTLNRPAFLPAPAFGLKLVFGEFGTHLLDSYRVYPRVLESHQYSFEFPRLVPTLESLAATR